MLILAFVVFIASVVYFFTNKDNYFRAGTFFVLALMMLGFAAEASTW